MPHKTRVVPGSFTDIGNGASVIKLLDSLFGELYLVGGAVRDEILGIETKDLDFATPEKVEDILTILKGAGFTVRENGRSFGTIATHIGDYDVQITSYRSEQYDYRSRKPLTAPTVDIDSDLSRRDFTINAMAVSKEEFIDPYNGLADIEKQLIRCVGQASTKLKEDPLRIIRAFRFVATLGYDIQPDTLSAAKDNRANIFILSSERIAEEFKKILAGNYWSDALYEMAESGVLSSSLRNLGVTYGVTAKNVLFNLDKFTQSELSTMDIPHRWCAFFSILIDAEKSEGVSTVSIESTIERLGNRLLLGKQLLATVQIVAEQTLSKHDLGIQESLEELEQEYERLKQLADSRSMVVGAKLAAMRGKKAFDDKSYALSANYYVESLHLLAENTDYLIKYIKDKEKRSARLEVLKSLYIDRFGRHLAAHILSEKLYLTYHSTEDLARHLKRKYHDKQLNAQDLNHAVDEALVRVYRLVPPELSLEPYEEFLKSDKRYFSKERQQYLLRRYYYDFVRQKSTDMKLRAQTYAKIAKIAYENAEGQNLGLEYFDPYIDSLLYFVRATTSIHSFWDKYDELEAETDHYLEIAKQQDRLRYATKRAYLNSATALAHGLSLAKKLQEKREISQLIVGNYTLAGTLYKKNADRFRIYLEWFGFLSWLLDETDTDDTAIARAIKRLLKTRSYKYTDPDETFFSTALKEIANIRNRLTAIHDALTLLLGPPSKVTDNLSGYKELDATLTLYNMRSLSREDAYKIIRNYYLKDVDKSIEAIPLGAVDSNVSDQIDEDLALIKTGESETIEFKEGWRYSRIARQIVPPVSRNIMKTISAFMNTQGGKIFIGVQDDGRILGLEETDFQIARGKTLQLKIDEIKLNIDEMFDKAIGSGKTSLKEITPKTMEGKTILIITVRPSPTPIFIKFDNEELFCVRSSASTRELSISETHSYIITTARFSTSNESREHTAIDK